MFSHFMALLLLGLGLQSPIGNPQVKGDSITNQVTTTWDAERGRGSSSDTAGSSGSARNLSEMKRLHLDSIESTTGAHKKFESRRDQFRQEVDLKRQEADARLKTKLDTFEGKLK